MKRTLSYVAYVLIAPTVAIALIAAYIAFFAGGFTDHHYRKLSSPKSNRLIIGTSRAAQGIRPDILGEGAINFAFTLATSPFGEAYYRAIEKKLADGRGVFIVEVSPLALSDLSIYTEPREQNGILGRSVAFSGHPNLTYFMTCYGKSLWRVAAQQSGPVFVHENGWVEVALSGERSDRVIRAKTERYITVIGGARRSQDRMDWFEKTIRLLAGRGDVTIVRLPVGSDMLGLEAAYWPDFSQYLDAVGRESGVSIVDLSGMSQDGLTTDGNHLTADASLEISQILSHAI